MTVSESSREVETLPGACYTSHEFYERELASVFLDDWFCLGRADQIPQVGDYFTVSVGPDPLIVIRSGAQTVHVLSAVCRHRSMVIAEDRGHCSRFLVCPYHSWTYDLTGRLRGAPDMTRTRGFVKEAVRLPSLKTEIWKGFIFATLNDARTALSARLAALEPLISRYDVESLKALPPRPYEFSCNWKIRMENGMECYHCSRLHSGYHDCAPSRNTVPVTLPFNDKFIVNIVETTHIDAALTPPDYKAFFPPLPGLTTQERSQMMWVSVLPNLSIAFNADNVHYSCWWPLAVDLTQIESSWMYPDTVIRSANFGEEFQYQLDKQVEIIEQDSEACERVQRGLRSRLASQSRLSWQEESVARFMRWLVDRYQEAGLDVR